MFYDETKTINACDETPTLVFDILKEDLMDLLDKILSRKNFDFNVTDEKGDSIMMKLLKKGKYDVVLKHMKDKRWDLNHQNNNGDTFAHILVSLEYSKVLLSILYGVLASSIKISSASSNSANPVFVVLCSKSS